MTKERFIVISVPTYDINYMVHDTALDRFICYCKNKADAVLIAVALNKQDEKIQTELKLSSTV